MYGQKVSSIDGFREATSKEWSQQKLEKVPLIPTPIGMQPTEHIRVNWEKRPYGGVKEIGVAVVHDGNSAAVFLQWKSAEKHPKDAVAVALPVEGSPVLMTMGQADAPIQFLHWMAGQEGVRSVTVNGIGSTRSGPEFKTSVNASWANGQWQVVIVRPLGAGGAIAPLKQGAKAGIGFAVWTGANDERAGLKAFSIDWKDLTLNA